MAFSLTFKEKPDQVTAETLAAGRLLLGKRVFIQGKSLLRRAQGAYRS